LDYKIEFTDKEITPWAGIVMLKKMLDKMEFDDCLSSLCLPEQGSNRGYSSSQLIKQFITSVWCGANKYEHTEVTRQDEVIRQFWGFKRMAGHKSHTVRSLLPGIEAVGTADSIPNFFFSS
jgi:hypothetical protein